MEEEILEIISDDEDEGERLNVLVDGFRRGRDVRQVLPLLRSENAEVVAIGAWIFSELPESRYSADEIVSALRGLTTHADAMVRFHALSAVYPFLDPQMPSTRTMLSKLAADENEGVRMVAQAAVARLGM